LRCLLCAIGQGLHQTFDKPPHPLGSRNLLQRTALIALLVKRFLPHLQEIPNLIQQAERESTETPRGDIHSELKECYQQIRIDFAPLAFLYDLRTYGGLAHSPNLEEAAAAAARLGLPDGNWHRTDYLRLLRLIAESVHKIAAHLEAAAERAPDIVQS
jgi:hypothetical protein